METTNSNESVLRRRSMRRFIGDLAITAVGIGISTEVLELVTKAIDHPLSLPVAVAVATGANSSTLASRRGQNHS